MGASGNERWGIKGLGPHKIVACGGSLSRLASHREQSFAGHCGKAQVRRGVGIYSVCSAHPLVIEASVLQALDDDGYLLVEATSNQVDQFGGYTGMKPQDFRRLVLELARRHGL